MRRSRQSKRGAGRVKTSGGRTTVPRMIWRKATRRTRRPRRRCDEKKCRPGVLLSVACVKELVRSARASEGREGQERTHRDAEGKRDEDDWAAQAGLQNPVQPDPPAEVLPREPPDELCGCASRVESQRPRADAHDRQSEAGRTTPTGNRTIMPTPPRTACATIVRCCGVHSLAESAPPAATVCVGISVASVLVPAARRGRCSRGSAAVRPSSEVGARGTHWTSACPCARSPSSRPRPSSRAR